MHFRKRISRKLLSVISLVVLSALLGSYPAAQAQEQPRSSLTEAELQSLRSVREARAATDNPRLATKLNTIYTAWSNAQQTGAYFNATSTATSLGLDTRNNRILVMMVMQDQASADQVLATLPGLGAEIHAHFETWIDVWLPVSALSRAANLPGVSIVQQPLKPVFEETAPSASDYAPLMTGPVTSEGVAASNAPSWHAQNHTGSGIKVAIMDSFANYANAQAAGEVPAANLYNPLNTSSVHGTAVAEIIYDMAPGVNLTLASMSNSTTVTQAANMIVDLSTQGHKVINASWGYYNSSPGDGTGPLANAIATAQANGTLFVASAGNDGLSHWDGNFVNFGNDSHQFSAGTNLNQFAVSSTRDLIFTLRWNNWPTTNQDYDLFLLYWDGSDWVDIDASVIDQATTALPPTEFIYYPAAPAGNYAIYIDKWSASGTQVLDLNGAGQIAFQFNNVARSLGDPGQAASSFTVSAIGYNNPYTIHSYSSQGPTHGPGGALAGGLAQPRIAGYACTSGSSWGYGLGNGSNTGFCGTSASAPHVAGAAALVFGRFAGYTPIQVKAYLEQNAVDLGTAGYDNTYGTGRLRLPTYIFADVPVVNKEWMAPWVESFYAAGITSGCSVGPLSYCPESSVTRAAMAVFILRAINGPSYTPPASGNIFADMPVAGKEWMEPWVNEFYDLGITSGCSVSPLNFCPEQPVTRAAMAVFILRALEGAGYTPDPTGTYFSDVPVAGKEWMEPWVDEFYERGITSGCGVSPLIYCPENPVTRAAMAVFVNRAFDSIPNPP